MSSSYTPQQLQQLLPIKKSLVGHNKKPKHHVSSGSTGSNSHQVHSQNRLEPPFLLYPTPKSQIDEEDSTTTVTSTTTSSTRPTLEQGWNSVVQLLRGRKRIAILTGAGISVSCGIPDFRTKGSGLYSTLDTVVRHTLSGV